MNLIILISIFSVFSSARKGESDFLVDAHKIVPATNDTMSQSVTKNQALTCIFKMLRVEASNQGRKTLGVMGDWTWRRDLKNAQDEDWTDWIDFWSQSSRWKDLTGAWNMRLRAPFSGHHYKTPNQPVYVATILKDSLRIGGISFQTSQYFIWAQFNRSSFEQAIMRGSPSEGVFQN